MMERRSAHVLVALVLAGCGDDGQQVNDGGSSVAADAGADDDGPAVGSPCADAATHAGEATYYDFADGSGNCGFPATPDDLMVGAMNHVDYAASAVCGACVHVEGPQGAVDLRIVDQCPECPEGDIDLSPEAFSRIAELAAGRVPITWQYAPCPVDGPVVYHFKDGSNPYWTAVQIRNHRNAIASFEVEQGGAWQAVERLDYNYFVDADGMGEGPYRFRVTDVLGHSLIDEGIALMADADVPGAAQFPGCP